MKLLLCLLCGDAYKVGHSIKTCSCGETSAFGFNDIEVAYSGDGVCIGLDNNVLRETLNRYADSFVENSKDRELKAWLIPFSAPHTHHISKKDIEELYNAFCEAKPKMPLTNS